MIDMGILKRAAASVLRDLALAVVDFADRLDPPAPKASDRVVLFTTDTTGTWTGASPDGSVYMNWSVQR